MSTLFKQKGRDTYYVSFFLNDKRITRNTNIPLTEPKKAELFKKELDAEITLGLLLPNGKTKKLKRKDYRLSFFIEQYIKLFQPNWSKKRLINVSGVMKYFRNIIKDDLIITDITPQKISDYIVERKKSVSVTTVRSDLQIIRAFFNYLVDQEILNRSPISKKLVPKPEHKAIITFDEGVLKSVLDEAKLIDLNFYRALYILSATGMRPGDLLNLQFKNIDLQENELKIKISKTSREIIFPLYNKLREFIVSEYPDLTSKNPEEKIFSEFYIYSLSRRFMRIKKRLNLSKDFNLKTFRKQYATSLIEAGVDGTIVAYLLGHTTVNTTTKYYLNKKSDKIRNNLNRINLDQF
jgi:integrase/recombinase XerD